ncbi:hypothetical protein ACVWXU_002378 [Streptomyces sp. TE33382]
MRRVPPRPTVTGTEESGTHVVRPGDVGPPGLGGPVGEASRAFRGQTGQPFPVDPEPFSTAYGVPAGHRLAPVTGTVDPLYVEHNPTGAQLTFSSPGTDPGCLPVPPREK